MDALQYVHVPRYSALILRRTFPDLNLPGAIMHRAKEWLLVHDAVHWNERDKSFTFPSGAQLTFGFLEVDKDRFRYQGSEYQYIGFDEGTQFQESEYLYLFTRLRSSSEMPVPLRMRMGTNPGNIGHEWVKARFIPSTDPVTGEIIYPLDDEGRPRVFVPARLHDNPYLDREIYEANLRELDPLTRQQLLEGDWGARPPGEMFDRRHVGYIERSDLPMDVRWCRAWDFASTRKRPDTRRDPDWTRGVLMGMSPSTKDCYVADIASLQGSPSEVERLVVATAARDIMWPEHRCIRLDLEPGSSGITVGEHYQYVLAGYDFEPVRPTGPKSERARPFAAYWRAGKVRLVNAPWNASYLAELEGFPNETIHDDQVDASSLAFQGVTTTYVEGSTAIVPSPRHNPYAALRRHGSRILRGGCR